MTGIINTVGSTQSPAQTVSTASASSANTTSAAAASADLKPFKGSSSTPISPRIVVDPRAGVITEFLSSNGEIQAQIPSTTVVAYLRAGLNADGLSKPDPGQSPKEKQGDSILA